MMIASVAAATFAMVDPREGVPWLSVLWPLNP